MPDISFDLQAQHGAAIVLSHLLGELKIPHAFIGGFALRLYGSDRVTGDIDVLLQVDDVSELRNTIRPRIVELDRHFAEVGLKLYFAPSIIEGLEGRQLVEANRGNILVETLVTNSLGLPKRAGPILPFESTSSSPSRVLPVMHPGVLILTKLKRWMGIYQSTRPQTIRKATSDRNDIEFLSKWLAGNKQFIAFTEYEVDDPARLDVAVKTYFLYAEEQGAMDRLARMRSVIKEDDLARIDALVIS